MYRFTVTAGQLVDFDIDTTLNGQGGLGSYIRLFDSQGQQLAANNDGAAPGENTIGFDAYLRYGFVNRERTTSAFRTQTTPFTIRSQVEAMHRVARTQPEIIG